MSSKQSDTDSTGIAEELEALLQERETSDLSPDVLQALEKAEQAKKISLSEIEAQATRIPVEDEESNGGDDSDEAAMEDMLTSNKLTAREVKCNKKMEELKQLTMRLASTAIEPEEASQPVTGAVPSNPTRPKKNIHEVPEYDDLSYEEKVAAINRSTEIPKADYNRLAKGAVYGQLMDGRYTIKPEHVENEGILEYLPAEEVNDMYRMWFKDAWGGLVNPPDNLDLLHFTYCIPPNTNSIIRHQKMIKAHYNLICSRGNQEGATRDQRKAFADYFKQRSAFTTEIEILLPDLLKEFTGTQVATARLLTDVLKASLSLQKELTDERIRMEKGVGSFTRSAANRLEDMKALLSDIFKTKDEKIGGVQKSSLTVVQEAEDTIERLSQSASGRESSLPDQVSERPLRKIRF